MRSVVTAITSAFLLSLSCSSDELEFNCVDPLGTDDYVTENGTWMCFLPDISGCFRIELESTPAIQSVYFEDHVYGAVIDVGLKTCLADISEKPTDGFSYRLEAKLHHGYVVSFPDGSYGRFFIQSWVTNSQGTVSEVNILRQYDY